MRIGFWMVIAWAVALAIAEGSGSRKVRRVLWSVAVVSIIVAGLVL